MLGLIHNRDKDVSFFSREAFLSWSMEMAVENSFEYSGGGDGSGWGSVVEGDAGFVSRWKPGADEEKKLITGEEIVSCFGYSVKDVFKDKLTLAIEEKQSLIFTTLFDNYTEDGDRFDEGVSVKIEIKSGCLEIHYTTKEDAIFSKSYDLPEEFSKNGSYFGKITTDALHEERVEIEIVSYLGKKGFATFHFNGEGTMYNAFYLQGDEGSSFDGYLFEGYFEIEDMNEAA